MRLYLSSFRLGNRPQEFVALLKGGANVAVIANAADLKSLDERKVAVEREVEDLRSLGLAGTEIDLRDYFGGNDDTLREDLSRFDALWVRGGNTFVLRRAFRQSSAEVAIPALLAQDRVVYAGYSAAGAILGSTLDGVQLVDDPVAVPLGYEPAVITEGLGILPYALAPHYRSDHLETAAVDEMIAYFIDHHMPFKALRDGQAMVRNGDLETVVG